MSSKRRLLSIILSTIAMLTLILDAKTAATAASEGILFCLRTVIPSLFPFFILSTMLTNNLFGQEIPILRFLGKLCRMPKGSECLFLIGILGGYPVGAQSIGSAYRNKQIEKHTAHRLLGFCSNAGPSFLFGIIVSQFSSKYTVWVLWLIHILSAVLTAMLLPGKRDDAACTVSRLEISVPQAVKRALVSMSQICGWVILSKVMLCFMDRWILWLIPNSAKITLTGILELSNGCWSLNSIPNEGLRFVVCCGILSFGGLCVFMQTMSVTGKLGLGMYLPGKLIQACISLILGYTFQIFLFHTSDRWNISLWNMGIWLVAVILFIVLIRNPKITVAFRKKMMYNSLIQR